MSSRQACRILVVDDQPNWRRALSILLEGEGFDVTQAASLKEAQTLIAQSVAFDLAILDVRLVDEDAFNVEGLDLLRTIRANSPVTRTVILTGYPESITKKPDADAILSKVPKGSAFDSAWFRSRIEELIGQPTSRIDRESGADLCE